MYVRSRGQSCGPTPPRRGTGSNARRSWRTAGGARRRPTSPPAAPASKRADRSGEAHAIADRIGARPLLGEIELLAQRARLDLAAPQPRTPDRHESLEETLGLTAREAEVLDLVARGYTNREIAATLIISAKTASVHVSHILHKLGAPNRREAAAIAHRVALPPDCLRHG